MAYGRKQALGVALGIGLLVAATGALAHNEARPKGPLTPAQKAAHARHENFEKLGGAFKAIIDELKKDQPNMALIQTNARTMTTLANGLPTWFPRGSGVEARPKAETKPNIWTDAAGFSAAAAAMQVQVSKLNQAAQAGDLNGVRAAIRPTGGSCKACHDKYRQEKS